MGDFQEVLAALLGKDAANLSPAVISRLTAEWQGEYERWQKRDLSARRYVYVWADGVFLQARMEDHGECMLVLIGATPEGKKELIGFQVGVRESTQSWRELLVEAKSRGLTIAPELAVGDGALGFWKALDAVFPATWHQRCWVHKTANVLNKVALSVQGNMKKDLREVYLAPNRASAEVAIDIFAEKYGAKYCKFACNNDPLRGDFRVQFRPLLTCCVSVLPFGPAGPGRALGDDWRGQDRRDTTRLF